MFLTWVIALLGLLASLALAYLLRQPGAGVEISPAGRYAALDRSAMEWVERLAVILGLTGFLALPLISLGLRDGLILLHTALGGLLIVALLPVVVLRAGRMGLNPGPPQRQGVDGTVQPDEPWERAAFWGMTASALVMTGTILGLLSDAVSQAGQGLTIGLHILSAILFLFALGVFAWKRTVGSRKLGPAE